METKPAADTALFPNLQALSRADGGTSGWLEPLIDRIICGEQEFLAAMRRYWPLLETYLQESTAGHPRDRPVGTDHYMLGQLGLADDLRFEPYLISDGFRSNRQSRQGAVKLLPRFGRNRRPAFLPHGFARMVAPDAIDFSRHNYRFEYLRRELLGAVRCLVLDVAPRHVGTAGRFRGRVWVEDQDGCIVRFNGTYTSSDSSAVFFHFDSWRFNLAPRVWLPHFTYIEDRSPAPGGSAGRIVGQIRLWGYNDAPRGRVEAAAEIRIESDQVEDLSDTSDIGPLASRRVWQRQAELNLIDRLDKSGLLAVEGPVDDTLNAVVHNLLASNDLQLDVRCRVLLTTPLETFSIGHTIIISRGLLDVLPDEASLAMVLSDELTHVVLGRPADTMFAFADSTMFHDRDIPRRLRFQRATAEMEAAHQKALEILSHSPYADRMATAGLFLKTLRRHASLMPNLIRANFGNQLTTEEDLVRLGELAKKTPELKTARGEQVAALPLGSRLKLDPWTNEVRMLGGKPLAPTNTADEAHFAVSPWMVHLTRSPCPVAEESMAEPKARSAAES